MLKPFMTITAITLSPYAQATIDVSIPKANCVKAEAVVKNKDLALLKSIYLPVDVPDSEYEALIKEVHDWAYVKSYRGINDFMIDDVKVFNDAKRSDNYLVKSSAERRGHDVEVWVEYSFKSMNRDTNAKATKGGYCKFALLHNNWYMINLLQ